MFNNFVVTKTEDDGLVGSLRWALEAPVDRIVTFSPSLDGKIIRLKSHINVEGDCLVDATDLVITIVGGRLRIIGSNVEIRNLRVRPTEIVPGGNFEDRDGISIGKLDINTAAPVSNVVLRSCSMTFAIDENLATWGGPTDIKVIDCLIANGLGASYHPQGRHSMGVFISSGVKNYLLERCFVGNNEWRNPAVTGTDNVQLINNWFSNFGEEGTVFYGKNTNARVIGNVYEAGSDTVLSKSPIVTRESTSTSSIYCSSNWALGLNNDVPIVYGPIVSNEPERDPLNENPIIFDEDKIIGNIVYRSGALPRDMTDFEILKNALKRTGKIIDVSPPIDTREANPDELLELIDDPATEPTEPNNEVELLTRVAVLEARVETLEQNLEALDEYVRDLSAYLRDSTLSLYNSLNLLKMKE